MPMPITPSNPVTALINLSLDAVALCNEGANSRAHILFTKRKEKESMPKTYEELVKALTPDQAQLITDHIDTLVKSHKSEVDKLNTSITTLNAQVETLQKSKSPAEEDILKSASPELKALIDKMQTSISALTAQREEDLVKERYAKVKALPIEEAELKGVLKSASPAVISILEKAAAAVEATLNPKGADTDNTFAGTSSDDFYAKLEKSAKTIMGETAGITFEKAFAMACEKEPETYLAYVKGGK